MGAPAARSGQSACVTSREGREPTVSGPRIALVSGALTLLAIVVVSLVTGNGDFARFLGVFVAFLAASSAVGRLRRRGRVSLLGSQALILLLTGLFVFVVRVM